MKLLSRIFGDHEPEIRKCMPVVERVNALDPDFEALSDADLRATTEGRH